jgi:hypothetical protein
MRSAILVALFMNLPVVASADILCQSMSAAAVKVQISQSRLTIDGLDTLGIPNGSVCQNSSDGVWTLDPLRISSYCQIGQMTLGVSAGQAHLVVTKDGSPVFLGSCQ